MFYLQLVLSPDSKHMIQSQVQEHFRKRRLQGDGNEIALDVVRGKGQGLTILIHGMTLSPIYGDAYSM